MTYRIKKFIPLLNRFKRFWYWLINKKIMKIVMTLNSKTVMTFDIVYRKQQGTHKFYPITVFPHNNFAVSTNVAIPCEVFINPMGVAFEVASMHAIRVETGEQ